MVAIRGLAIMGSVAVAALALAFAPVTAASTKASFHGKQPQRSFRFTDSIGSFTPAAADPRRSLSFGQAGLSSIGFHFTPSAAPGSRRAVTVAIRARGSNAAVANRGSGAGIAIAALTPAAYNLGVAVGWRRFALTGDVARVEGGVLPIDRELADVGFSFAGKKWSTRLQLGTERAIGVRSRLAGTTDEAYSVDLGGSYSLTRNLEVTGGVRYKTQRDRLEAFADNRRDSQAVYIGTAFKF